MKDLRGRKIFSLNSEKQLFPHFEKAYRIKDENFGRKMYFFAPSFMHYRTTSFCSSQTSFPTISVTGGRCALNCKHCGGKILNTMHSCKTPDELFELCASLKRQGCSGCLVSGGCLPNGSVPLGRFFDVLKKVNRELGLQVAVHTGIINSKTADELKRAEVDAALIDVIGSNETIKEIFHLNVDVQAYENSLLALERVGIPFIPHVIVGLHYGKLKGELDSLRLISKVHPATIVLIAFMPLHGTDMEKISPSKPLDIAKVMITARLMFPQTPLALGCMRPRGKHRRTTDLFAIKSGINAIAFPTQEAIEYATVQMKNEIFFSSNCCALVHTEM